MIQAFRKKLQEAVIPIAPFPIHSQPWFSAGRYFEVKLDSSVAEITFILCPGASKNFRNPCWCHCTWHFLEKALKNVFNSYSVKNHCSPSQGDNQNPVCQELLLANIKKKWHFCHCHHFAGLWPFQSGATPSTFATGFGSNKIQSFHPLQVSWFPILEPTHSSTNLITVRKLLNLVYSDWSASNPRFREKMREIWFIFHFWGTFPAQWLTENHPTSSLQAQ